MDEKIINTLEKENLKLASLTQRMLAYTIDVILCFVVAIFVIKFSMSEAQMQYYHDGFLNENLLIVNEYVMKFFYFFILIRFVYNFVYFYFYGATLGNMLTKCRVINYLDLDKPTFFQAIIRTNMLIFCEIVTVLFLSVFINRTRRHIGDLLAQTIVIRVD